MKTHKRKVIIPAGTSWTDSVMWLTTPYVYKDVVSIETTLPTTLGVVAHGIPIGSVVPVYLTNTGTLKLDTTPETPRFVRAETVDTLVLDGVDSTKRAELATVPRISYLTPKNLSGYAAKIQYKFNAEAPVLVELTNGNGITIENSTITVSLTPTQSRALLNSGVIETSGSAFLELINGTEVYQLIQYDWTCPIEWTKDV